MNLSFKGFCYDRFFDRYVSNFIGDSGKTMEKVYYFTIL